MKYNPDIHNRRSIRLKGYDYSSAGAYFITICAYQRMLLFENEEIQKIINDEWFDLSNRFGNIKLDEYIIMPNHFHCIIMLIDSDKHIQASLCNIVQAFKSLTTHKYIKSEIINRIDFPARLWHRNYYDHIIRNDKELASIREYIRNNPVNWLSDPDNPTNFIK